MRRFGESRRYDTQYIRRPGAYAIIAEGDRLLLTLQDAADLELQLPGGGIDPGETATRALHREVFEETGHGVYDVRRLGAYQRFTYMEEYDLWAHKICHIYVCKPGRRYCEPPESDHSVVWMTAKEATTQLTNSGDQHFLRQWIARSF